MKIKRLNEDCGCGGKAGSEPVNRPVSKNISDPNVGKVATLFDGRQALVDDSIRNSDGQTIGYVLNSGKMAFRVFKDKIQNFSESEGGLSSLDATNGMGNVSFPTANHDGSGDMFPTIGGGVEGRGGVSKKKTAAGKKKNQFTYQLMGFMDFAKTMKGFQQPDKTNKK